MWMGSWEELGSRLGFCSASEWRKRASDTRKAQQVHLWGGTGRAGCVGGRHPPSACLWGVHLPPSPASPSPTPPEVPFRAAAVAGESVWQLRHGAAPSAAEMPANLPADSETIIINECNALFPPPLPPSSFSWHGESVIKVPLSFCGVVGELVVVPVGTSYVGQISCILV